MNTLKFLRLRYKNLLSTGNLFTEIDLASHPMTLVVGDNGDGKSTMIDALCFALFKKPFRKINLPQLVNSVTKRELVVEVEFESRGHHYLVRRGQKPNLFEVYRDGQLIDQTAVKDYQASFEKTILRTNHKTFVQIVILGSASYVPFMQLKPGERRPIVEDIYDCGIFTAMRSALTSRVSVLERDVNRLENERDLLNQKLELARGHQSMVADDKQKWIEAKLAEIDSIQGKIASLTAERSHLRETEERLKPVIDDWNTAGTKTQELRQLKVRIEANGSGIKRDIEWLKSHADCPTCKQVIAEGFKAAAIEAKTSKLNEIEDGLAKLQERIDEAKESMDRLGYAERERQGSVTRRFVLDSEVSTHEAQIRKIQREIDTLQGEQDLAMDEATVVETESAILEKRRELGEYAQKRDAMEYLGALLRDNGIKARIIKKYSGTFNQLVNAYLAKLDFFVDFYLDEEFEETIRSRGRDSFSYNSFSEGEKLRIDLAVLFAWRDIARMRASLNTNLLIMDEIFDGSLDSQGVEELLKVMKGVVSENNVFVISHQIDRLDGHFDRKLRFTKTKGFSRIIE